jgi:hypothetical protein
VEHARVHANEHEGAALGIMLDLHGKARGIGTPNINTASARRYRTLNASAAKGAVVDDTMVTSSPPLTVFA